MATRRSTPKSVEERLNSSDSEIVIRGRCLPRGGWSFDHPETENRAPSRHEIPENNLLFQERIHSASSIAFSRQNAYQGSERANDISFDHSILESDFDPRMAAEEGRVYLLQAEEKLKKSVESMRNQNRDAIEQKFEELLNILTRKRRGDISVIEHRLQETRDTLHEENNQRFQGTFDMLNRKINAGLERQNEKIEQCHRELDLQKQQNTQLQHQIEMHKALNTKLQEKINLFVGQNEKTQQNTRDLERHLDTKFQQQIDLLSAKYENQQQLEKRRNEILDQKIDELLTLNRFQQGPQPYSQFDSRDSHIQRDAAPVDHEPVLTRNMGETSTNNTQRAQNQAYFTPPQADFAASNTDHINSEVEYTQRHHTDKPKSKDVQPDRYKGDSGWCEYLVHFEMCAELNNWGEEEKAKHLAINLRGNAQKVLSNLLPEEKRNYKALVKKLEDRFGTEGQSEVYKAKLTIKKKSSKESYQELAENMTDLVMKAYPSASQEMVNSLTLEKFIEAITDHEVKIHVKTAKCANVREAAVRACEIDAIYASEGSQNRPKRLVNEIKVAPNSNPDNTQRKNRAPQNNKQKGVQQIKEGSNVDTALNKVADRLDQLIKMQHNANQMQQNANQMQHNANQMQQSMNQGFRYDEREPNPYGPPRDNFTRGGRGNFNNPGHRYNNRQNYENQNANRNDSRNPNMAQAPNRGREEPQTGRAGNPSSRQEN